MSRFHNYSFGSILEIARQRPTATRVAGLYAWNQLGRKVMKGEKGMLVMGVVCRQGKNDGGHILNRMKCVVLLLLVFTVISGQAQMGPQNISSAQLQALLDLPLDQAIQRRNTYKEPLKAAYARQIALIGKDCQTEAAQGQQPYNICMGQADEEADRDYATFYNNLQMLCHNQEQLKTLQSTQRTWKAHRESAMNAARAAWSSGTGAPGFAGQVYLTLLRDNMRELYEIYGLNISQ